MTSDNYEDDSTASSLGKTFGCSVTTTFTIGGYYEGNSTSAALSTRPNYDIAAHTTIDVDYEDDSTSGAKIIYSTAASAKSTKVS